MQPLKVNVYMINTDPQVVKNKICGQVKLKIIWDILEQLFILTSLIKIHGAYIDMSLDGLKSGENIHNYT